MDAQKQSIGVLGGTFDPVHNGHVAIAKSFLKSGYIDSLCILLTPNPPHKSDREFANYSERLRMLMAVFHPIEKVKVSGLEFTLPRPSYTYQTMRYLKKSKPNNTFYLCLGEDSYLQFKKWYNWKGILEFCELLVAERPETKKGDIDEKLSGLTHFIEHTPVAVSSSAIREKLKNGETIDELVPEAVARIIQEENLYKSS